MMPRLFIALLFMIGCEAIANINSDTRTVDIPMKGKTTIDATKDPLEITIYKRNAKQLYENLRTAAQEAGSYSDQHKREGTLHYKEGVNIICFRFKIRKKRPAYFCKQRLNKYDGQAQEIRARYWLK